MQKETKLTSKRKIGEQENAPNELAALHLQHSWRLRWRNLILRHFIKTNCDGDDDDGVGDEDDDHSAIG